MQAITMRKGVQTLIWNTNKARTAHNTCTMYTSIGLCYLCAIHNIITSVKIKKEIGSYFRFLHLFHSFFPSCEHLHNTEGGLALHIVRSSFHGCMEHYYIYLDIWIWAYHSHVRMHTIYARSINEYICTRDS